MTPARVSLDVNGAQVFIRLESAERPVKRVHRILIYCLPAFAVSHDGSGCTQVELGPSLRDYPPILAHRS